MLDVAIYNFQVVLGLILFIYGIKKHPDLMRFDLNKVFKFAIIFSIAFFIRGILYVWLNEKGAVVDLYSQGINSLLAVWWEDCVFVLPFLILHKNMGKKSYYLFPVFIATSFYFALGHLYQGPTGWVSFIYPFISFYFARKNGLGTVMLCHIIYDVLIAVMLSGFAETIRRILWN